MKLEEIAGKNIEELTVGELFDKVMQNVDKIDNNDFGRVLSMLPKDKALMAMKERCNVGDKVACKVYKYEIYGNPEAPAGTDEYLGYMGRWQEKKDATAGKILVLLDEL